MAPALYSFIVTALPFLCMAVAAYGYQHHRLGDAVAAFTDGALFLYALVFMVGVKPALQDIVLGAREALKSGDELLASLRRIPLLARQTQRN
jgi:hypothetical protein